MDPAELVKKATDVAHVGRSFGTGYERDDCLVIPVAWVLSVGGGGGGTGKPKILFISHLPRKTGDVRSG